MKAINIHNYEAFYLDYIEGNLNKEECALLFQFLDENPALKSELEDFEPVLLNEINDGYNLSFNKELLKHNIDSTNAEEYIIADLENEIDSDDKKDLDLFISNSKETMLLANRYKKTILPIPVLSYPQKEKLKKRNVVLYYVAPLTGAAAAVLLIFLLQTNKTEFNDLEINTIANNDSVNSINVIKNEPKVKLEKGTSIDSIAKASVISSKNTNQSKLAIFQANEFQANTILDTLQKQQKGNSNKDFVTKRFVDTVLKLEDKKLVTLDENASTKNAESQHSHVEALTIKEFIGKIFRKRILGKDDADDKKADSKEVVAVLANKIEESTNGAIAYSYEEQENRTSYSINIGNFEFSRSKKK